MAEVKFTLPAIHCDGCVSGIQMASRLEKRVTGVRGEKGSKTVTVTWNEDETGKEAITEWLTSIGYEPADR